MVAAPRAEAFTPSADRSSPLAANAQRVGAWRSLLCNSHALAEGAAACASRCHSDAGGKGERLGAGNAALKAARRRRRLFASSPAKPPLRYFQSVLNQWAPRRLDDQRLCALATPRQELKERRPMLLLSARQRRPVDADRIQTLAKPKQQAVQRAEPRSVAPIALAQARSVDAARLAELAAPSLRRGMPAWEVNSRMSAAAADR
eukprot:CAMPEP_0176095416 /NCGR_PEP_ID=MMETSP0120_2-20121206/47825_1 /TAXON_ID=160619 /ORGANISM="Kryptoperidinium foliaceum, Strain CCMP 1326" /LENGTH=203 /DNA_ID=CAMNT_0017429383 /DNA_START=21 /DNA_END=630 /DNA_ORIENTATION=+